MDSKNNSFTEGPILKPLLTFTFPILLALLLQTAYGSVDLLVIGRYCTSADVSAVSTGSQIMHMITSVVSGLSMGTTVLIGQKLGQKDPEGAGITMGTGIYLFAVIGVVLTAMLVPLAGPLSRLMQAPEAALEATGNYVRICGAGSFAIIAYNVLGSIFRGIGDSKTPLIAVAIACVSNIFLDLLFVTRFHMGVSGVALATVLAQLISVVLSVLLIRKHGLPFPFGKKQLTWNPTAAKRTLGLGFPIALQDFLVSISFLVILAIVNSLGVIASAGVGVAEKLCGIILLFPSAFMQSMSAFTAQNIGAGRRDRAKKAMVYGMLTAFSLGLVLSYLGFFHGEMLAGIFSSEADVKAAAASYLKAYAIDTLLTSFMFCFVGYFNGCGQTGFVMFQGIASAFGVRIPFSFFMSRTTTSLFLIGLATPCSTFVQILMCLFWFRHIEKKAKQLS